MAYPKNLIYKLC